MSTIGAQPTVPKLEPQDDIKIGGTAPFVTRTDDGPLLRQMTWAWKGPGNKRSVNRRPKRTPYRRAKGTPLSSSVTGMTGAPFALVAA